MEGFWDFVLEKFLNVQNLMDSSVRTGNKRVLREMQAINAWHVKFQRYAKTLPGLFV